jgi:hypothetical protein
VADCCAADATVVLMMLICGAAVSDCGAVWLTVVLIG